MTELAIMLGLIVAGIAAVFGIRASGAKAGKEKTENDAMRRDFESLKRGRDERNAAHDNDQPHADSVRSRDDRW